MLNFINQFKSIILLCCLVVFVGAFVGYCVAYKGIDFYTYLLAAKAFHQHARPYLSLMFSYPYYYPPLTAQLIAPLIYLPPKIALLIWLSLSVMATAISVFLLTDGKKITFYLILAFGFLPVATTFYAGQVGAFLLLALSFTYFIVSRCNQYPGKQLGVLDNLAAGLGIALGIMLKIIPLAHWAYFIWRGKIGVALATLGCLILLFAISLPFVGGWQGWLDFLHIASYYGNPSSLHAHGFNQVLNIGSNQALSGMIARLINNDYLSLKIWHVSAIILISMTAWICRPRGNFVQLFTLEFSLVTIGITLVMPYTWYHQYLVLLIPLITLLKRAETDTSLQRLRWPLAIGYVLTDLHGLFWHHLHIPALTSFPVYFALFLWIVVARQITFEARIVKHLEPLPGCEKV